MTRNAACFFGQGTVNVINTDTNTYVGQLFFNVISYTYTLYNFTDWAHQLSIEETPNSWGLVGGSSVDGAAVCTGPCTVPSNNFPPQPMAPGTVDNGLAIFAATQVGLGQKGSAVTSFDWLISNAQWVGPVLFAPYAAPSVRCDNALGGGTTSGCVFPGYTPTMTYSLSGPYPQLAEHIAYAQVSGLAGAPGGSPLYRTQDPNINTLNSSTACSALTKPAGFQCDEYPFASTYEGAYEEKYVYGGTARTWSWCQITLNAPNSTGPYGWSVCMINATQNAQGGLALQTFYYGNRVLDSDTFYTQITS